MAVLAFSRSSVRTRMYIGVIGVLVLWSITTVFIFYSLHEQHSAYNYNEIYVETATTLETLNVVMHCMKKEQAKTKASFAPRMQLVYRVEYCWRRTQSLLYFMYYDVGSQLLSLTQDSFNLFSKWMLSSAAQQDYEDYILDLSREVKAFNSAVMAIQLNLPLQPRRAVEYCVLLNSASNINLDKKTSFMNEYDLFQSSRSFFNHEQTNIALQNFVNRCAYFGSITKNWQSFLSVLTKRHFRIRKMSEFLASKIKQIQYPEKCETQRTLVCELYKVAGFTSEVKRALYCFSLALATGRTLQLDSEGFLKGNASWSDLFQLPTSCEYINKTEPIFGSASENETSVRVAFYDNKRPIYQPEYRPRTIPKEISEISALHGDPFEWFSGQLVRFLLRMKPEVRQIFEDAVDALQLTYPIVGMHIRRTDKSEEVPPHSIKEYFNIAELFYRKLELQDGITTTDGNIKSDKNAILERRVYLATDDPKVIKEAREKYPHYTIIADVQRCKMGTVNERYSSNGILGALVDIYALARTNFVVCTLSSNLCAMVNTLKQTTSKDASTSVLSLDIDRWTTKSHYQKNRTFIAVHKQLEDKNRGLISVLPGDKIYVDYKEKFNIANGFNTRTRITGYVRLHKLAEVFDTASYNFTAL